MTAQPQTAPVRRANMPASDLDVHACEAFLLHEARLLDDGKFDDWLALFTPDARYWVPSEPNQANPHDTVSLMFDDRKLLETRVRRLASPRIYSQEPRSRTSRIVTNVMLEDGTLQSLARDGSTREGSTREVPGAERSETVVRSKFMIVEFRRNEQRMFAGTYFHRLVRVDSAIRIASKRTDLVNCDAPMDGLVVPF